MTIADGTQATPGDLLRIEAITRNGLLVRRALGPGRRTGQALTRGTDANTA